MCKKELTWENVKASLNFSPEEVKEIIIEEQAIELTIKTRKRIYKSNRMGYNKERM